MSDKPDFDPNQPFTVADKPAFDPNQPFQTAGEAPKMGFLESTARSTVNALPMVGGVVGGILGTPLDAVAGPMGNVVGAGLGGYLGTAAKNAINSQIDPENAPKTLPQTVLDPVVGGAEQALNQGVGEGISNGIGMIKGPLRDYLTRLAEIKSAKGMGATAPDFRKLGEEGVRKIGRYGLDEGVVSPLASTDTMLDRNLANQNKAMETRQQIYDKIDAPLPQPKIQPPESVAPPSTVPTIQPQQLPKTISQEFPPALSERSPGSGLGMNQGRINQLRGNIDSANLAAVNDSGFNPYKPETQAVDDLGYKFENSSANESSPLDLNSMYGSQGTKGSSEFNPLEAAQAVKNKAGNFNPDSPLNDAASNQLDKIIEAIRSRGTQNISMSEAQALQEEIGRAAKFDATRSTGANDVAKSAYGASREYLNQAAENAAEKMGGSSVKETIQNANKTYSMGEKADVFLNKQSARELGNKTFGLTDTITGVGLSGNPAEALGAVGVKKTLEKYGNQSIAVGADKLADAIKNTPASFGKFSSILTNAASRGGNSLNATDYILQQTNPEYRAQRQKVFSTEGGSQ